MMRAKNLVKVSCGMLLIWMLAGCQEEKAEQLQVTIDSNKNQLSINEPVKVEAQVTFGNEQVEDEADVQFEIIENGVSVGTVPPKSEGDGKYSLETMFLTEGQHQITAHVDYKDFHEMPTLTLEVEE